MQLDVVNSSNEKVGTVDVNDTVFGGRINEGLIWESVVRANAAKRQGTHATKTRAQVSGSGKKPWRQKGTGRARVGEIRNPLWRKGGTVFGPQPRSYEYQLPKKVELGALRAALAEKVGAGHLVIVDALSASEIKTQAAAAMLKKLGVEGKAVLIDLAPDDKLARSVRNLPGIALVASGRVTARDVANADRVITTRGAFEKLQEALGWLQASGVRLQTTGSPKPEARSPKPKANEMKLTDIIRRPLITEKTSILREDGKTIVFQVAREANKVEIKRAIEKLLGAKVASVRTSLVHGKIKRQGRFAGQRPDWKKAYVTLREGEKMPEFLEGA